MIKLESLTIKSGNSIILSNVNLSVERGSVYALVGSNGAGKTTLLNYLSSTIDGVGVYKYFDINQGESNLFGDDIYYVPDQPWIPFLWNLRTYARNDSTFYKDYSMDKFDKLLKYFRVDPSKSISRLSKGQKKIAFFICSIASNCPVILLDELLDGLDVINKEMVWRVIDSEIEQRELTVVISSHDLKELNSKADRIGIIHEGKMISEESIDKLKEKVKKYQLASHSELRLNVNDRFKVNLRNEIGSITYLTVSGDCDCFEETVQKENDLVLFQTLDMSLEDLFISELGGNGYASKDYE
jgi:ABC-2 type transport system ATP-binding protein